MISNGLSSIQKHWRMVIGLILVIFSVAYLLYVNNGLSNERQRISGLEAEIVELKKELALDPVTEEDLVPDVELIEQSGVRVDKMAEEIVNSQLVLANAYMSAEPLSDSSEKELAELEEAKLTYTRLTGVTNFVDLWLFNADWRLELESVGTYADFEKIPVIFSIYTKDNELAGIVRGEYNIEKDFIEDVSRDYTELGMTDRSDVGGR